MPCGRALSGRRTRERHAIAKVAAFGHSAVRIECTVGVWLTEIAVADSTGGAFSVGGALTEIDASVPKTLEAHRTISRA